MMAIRNGLVVALLILWLPACTAPAPATYFRLAPPTPAGGATVNADAPTLGVWPVILPDELARAELVSYGMGAEVLIAGRYFWAGSLQDNVDRYLAVALQRELAMPVLRYPWGGRERLPRQLRVRLLQLGGELGKQVVIDAQWSLSDTESDGPRARGQFYRQLPLSDGSYPTYIGGLRDGLDQLAQAIARSVSEVEP